MTPHALDLTIALIIVLSTLVAYFRGIVREFFMLAGLALATFVSLKAGHLLVPDVSKWLDAHPETTNEKASALGGLLTPTIATDVVSYGGIFLAVVILMIILRMMVSHWVNGAGLTLADRVGGAVFGFARGFLLVLIVFGTCLYMGYAGETDNLPEWAKNSVSVPILETALAWTDKNVDLKGSLKTVADKIQHVNFDKVSKDAGDATSELKNEVKKEEKDIQKSTPDTPAGPVPNTMPEQPAPVVAPATPVPPPAAATPAPAPAPAPAAPAPAPGTPGTPPSP